MILRKPYAFLIRKFRLIHLILSLILIYITYSTNKIFDFFNNYVGDKTETYFSKTSILFYLVILLVIGIFSTILVLMNRKQKPSKYYLFGIIYYIFVIFILLIANSQLYDIEIGKTNTIMLNITRDLLLMAYLVQYIFIIMALVRATGFNIKKFDFQKDLKDLDITESDNEEFEFDVELDVNDVKTKIKRNIRIFKYILKENRKLVIVLLSGGIIWSLIQIVLNVFVYDVVYRENQSFKVNTMSVKVLNSYSTRKNYHLEDITTDKYIYNIVEVKIKNNGTKDKVLNTEKIKLKTNDYTSYTTDTKSYKNFIDIGVGYSKQKIKPKEEKVYIFAFKINSKEDKNKKTFQMLVNLTYEEEEYKYNYARVKINTENLDKIKQIKTYKLGDTLTFDDNFVYNTKLKINKYSFSDILTYAYIKKINDKEYTFTKALTPSSLNGYGRIMMQIESNLELDNRIKNESIKEGFLGNFLNVRYVIDKKEYNPKIIVTDYTPNNITDLRYLDVYEKVPNAEHIYLDFYVRNIKYVYKLK